ncbi:MAG: spermidine synthase [Desulfitobacteriaceae bacterium]
MINQNELILFGVGISFTLVIECLIWLYWRYCGAGSLQEYISKDEEPDGDYSIIKKIKNPEQKIALVEQDGDFYVFANGSEMFSTAEGEDKYAEALIHVPMAVAQKRESVLIIGSGGGISTREVLCYPEVNEITAVDIDATIMDFGKKLEPFVRFNKGSLNNPKVRTVIQDGRGFLENSSEKWDVIIIDLPEPTSSYPELGRLFSVEFYNILKEHLEPGGVITVACSVSSEMPSYYWAVQATIMAAGFYTLPYHFDYIVEWGQDWGFCLAATKPISISDVQIKASTRYLNQERLNDMLRIPYYLLGVWDSKNVQTDHNNLLVDVVEETWKG